MPIMLFGQDMSVLSDLPEDVRKDILSRVNQNQQTQTNIDEPNFVNQEEQSLEIKSSDNLQSQDYIFDQLSRTQIKIFGSEVFKNNIISNGSARLVDSNYLIGPGDIFEIIISGSNPVFQSRFMVNQNGSIFIPSVGEINILGMPFILASEDKEPLLNQESRKMFQLILSRQRMYKFMYMENLKNQTNTH